MTEAAPAPSSDRDALEQIERLIAYAESTGQTLLAAMLSEAADVLDHGKFMFESDGS